MEPFDVLDAGRMAVCADPAGAVFNLWQLGTHRGAQAVNEPGTWNWSDLVTADIEGAKAFYGAVFGWEADATEFGALMWRLPGYADFWSSSTPGFADATPPTRTAVLADPEGAVFTISHFRP